MMTVDVLRPPPEVWRRMSGWISTLASNDAFMTRKLCRCHIGNLSLAAPQPRFCLTSKDVGLNGNVERAYMVGWRYLACAEGEAIAFAELAAEGPSAIGDDIVLSESPVVQATASVLESLKGGYDNGLRTHALGILSVPSLHAEFIWLRHRRSAASRDRFIPVLLPNRGRLLQVLRLSELMKVLVDAKVELRLEGTPALVGNLLKELPA
ncbi:hypothetical protein WKW80_35395 [Variovorax humicola]|uniref:Uncharacterized protein n=1 Tax=Variovorax humicola TaxID=1769758 RepID=A0ABU8WD60_9BURK